MSIVIYSKPNCTYCVQAKDLLRKCSMEFEEKMFGKDFMSPEELYEAVGKQVRTMPQIMIDGELVGGFNHLKEYLLDKGYINFQGEIIEKNIWGLQKKSDTTGVIDKGYFKILWIKGKIWAK